jgi:2-polyprenyl-6-methoxyphenol hydroxylase-like FAD-dependent oxidoreductase
MDRIVGGGLSGILLANGLLSNDFDFTIYERDAANSKREGYQTRLGDSTITGFKTYLSKDRMELITQKFGQSSG